MTDHKKPLEALRYHVTGKIERGEGEAITAIEAKAGAHTPGPWHTGQGKAAIIIYATDGYAIADAKTYHTRERDHEANARLIAAAPELLEACNLLLELSEQELSERQQSGSAEEYDRLQEIVDQARETIRKATEEPAT